MDVTPAGVSPHDVTVLGTAPKSKMTIEKTYMHEDEDVSLIKNSHFFLVMLVFEGVMSLAKGIPHNFQIQRDRGWCNIIWPGLYRYTPEIRHGSCKMTSMMMMMTMMIR